MKKNLKLLLCLSLMVSFLAFSTSPVLADSFTNKIKGESINTDGTGDVEDVTDLFDEWVTNLRIVGVFIAIVGIVLGAIAFSVSMGNATRRGIGISAMICAAASIVIIAKAPTLAAYFLNA